MNLNKVFILGRTTADPQIRSTNAGQAVGTFSVATNRVWMDKTGGKKEEVEFHNIVVWGRQAEIAGQFLKKGALVFVEGRLQTRSWQDQSGGTRKTTEVICERMQLGPRPSSAGGFSPTEADDKESVSKELPEIDLGDDEIKPEDLPF